MRNSVQYQVSLVGSKGCTRAQSRFFVSLSNSWRVTGSRRLEDEPDDDDDVAGDECSEALVQIPTWQDGRHPVYPRVPCCDSEHGDEGAVELAKRFRRHFAEK